MAVAAVIRIAAGLIGKGVLIAVAGIIGIVAQLARDDGYRYNGAWHTTSPANNATTPTRLTIPSENY